MSELISVKDRVPEIGTFSVCIAKRNPFSGYIPMVVKRIRNGFVNPVTEQYITEIKCWMPLPEPPEEE